MASGTTDSEEFADSIKEVDGTIVGRIGEGALTIYVVQTEKGKLSETEGKLARDEHIACVQRNFYVQMQVVPNDPYYPSQWHLPAMNLPAAWDKTGLQVDYSKAGKQWIAVLDSGTKSWTPELNGRCDVGYDAVTRSYGQAPIGHHGTMIATAIGAATNNRLATAAVNPRSVICPIKVCDARGNVSESAILEALYYCGNHDIHIVNLSINAAPPYSLSNRQYHPAFHIYADWFHNTKNGLIFIAAGNHGKRDLSPRSPNLIVVSAISRHMTLALFSNYGDNVWFTAPGQGVWCSDADNRPTSVSGTSMSAPCAAAVAALIWGTNPGLKNTDIEHILAATCYKAGTRSQTRWYGFGLPNASAGVKAAGFGIHNR